MAGEDWIECKLGEACSSIDYGLTASASGVAVGPRFLRITDIVSGSIDWNSVPYVAAGEAEQEKYRLDDGDIVLARTGASTGVSAYVKEPPGAVFASYLVRLKAKPEFDSRFLAYYLKGDAFWSFIRGVLGDKSAQPNASASTMTQAPLRAPRTKATQGAIAHILGSLDDKIELNRRMNETLEAIARALFKSWFVDFDPVRARVEGRDSGLPKNLAALFPDSFQESEVGKIPRGWELGVLDQLIEVVLGGDWGGDDQTEELSEPARCIRGADIPDLQMGGAGKMPVRFLRPSSLKKRRLNSGDLVVEISGGGPTQSTGRPVLLSRGLLSRVNMPLVCSNFCRLLKPRLPAFSTFVYLWLRWLYSNDELLQFENGTTGIKNFAFTLFRSSYKLCMPPLEILEAFDQQVSPLFDKQQANGTENDILVALRNTLLPKLISGQLRLKDAERMAAEASS
ncbi:MAG TPA: restriction endonuclease subunit S [Thermoanaerobaculia bacterium]|nr:restriction endonuclease subunit S [Thermoanaerobaculia bacterium]